MIRITPITLVLLFLTLIISGCATSPTANYAKREDVQIEKVSSRKGEVGNTQVYQQANTTIVRGSIRRKTASRVLNGHVHVNLYNAENTLLDKTTVDYRLQRKGNRTASTAKFQAVLGTLAPQNARIVVKHHDGDHPEENQGTLNIM